MEKLILRKVILNSLAGEKRAAVLEDDKVVEWLYEWDEVDRSSNIILGKVIDIVPGMDAAFVDIGTGKNGFLYKKELVAYQNYMDNNNPQAVPPKINSFITKGESIVVQILKESTGTKGARLTEMVTYPGKYLVYMPYASYIAVSKKMADPVRERWRSLGGELIQGSEGLIFRTVSESADEEDILEELAWLRMQHEEMLKKRNDISSIPSVLYSQSSIIQRIYFDFFSDGHTDVIVDNADDYQKFVRLGGKKLSSSSGIKQYQGKENIFHAYDVEKQLEKSLSRKVWLKNGGFLIIDSTEAMTVIDVNTGKFIGKENLQETVLKTNVDAANAVAEHLRLRDIGGIILIDFIDMKKEEHQSLILETLKKALKKDRTLTNVGGFTKFGLVELTRKRSRKSLAEVLQEPCHICHGVGRVPSLTHVLSEFERDLQALRNSLDDAVLVEVYDTIMSALLEDGKKRLLQLEDTYRKIIYLVRSDQGEAGGNQCTIRLVGNKDELKETWKKRLKSSSN